MTAAYLRTGIDLLEKHAIEGADEILCLRAINAELVHALQSALTRFEQICNCELSSSCADAKQRANISAVLAKAAASEKPADEPRCDCGERLLPP